MHSFHRLWKYPRKALLGLKALLFQSTLSFSSLGSRELRSGECQIWLYFGHTNVLLSSEKSGKSINLTAVLQCSGSFSSPSGIQRQFSVCKSKCTLLTGPNPVLTQAHGSQWSFIRNVLGIASLLYGLYIRGVAEPACLYKMSEVIKNKPCTSVFSLLTLRLSDHRRHQITPARQP